MEMATITSKGQVTVPKRVRQKLAMGSGDQLAFAFDEHGALRITPVRSPLPPLPGLLAEDCAGRKPTTEQIDDAIRTRMRRRYGSS